MGAGCRKDWRAAAVLAAAAAALVMGAALVTVFGVEASAQGESSGTLYGHVSSKDIDLDTAAEDCADDDDCASDVAFNQIKDMWSDGSTLWVADGLHNTIAAFSITAGDTFGDRLPSKDISVDEIDRSSLGSAYALPWGLWSDGTTLYVLHGGLLDENAEVRGYALSDGSRDTSKDFTLHEDNDDESGLWSDGTTMWVADSGDRKLFAYTLSTGSRDSGEDLSLVTDNGSPRGMWSDGTTVWVTDSSDEKVYAYTWSTGDRATTHEFSTIAQDLPLGGYPQAIWANSSTMWIGDLSHDVVNAYSRTGTRVGGL